MARARNIKPGFYKNEHLGECSPLAALLFPGLWMLADKRGVLEDKPKKIKAEVFPYRDCNVESFLDELSSLGFLKRYEEGGFKCIQILNFNKHQRPHPQEPENGLPLPSDGIIAKNDSTLKEMTNCAFPSSSLNPSSLNAESLSPGASAPEPAKPAKKPKRPTIDLEHLLIPADLDTDQGRQAISDWLAYKRGQGCGYTKAAYVNGLLEDFARDGPAALAAAVKFSIGNGYKGLFRPKEGDRGNQRKPDARSGFDPEVRGDIG